MRATRPAALGIRPTSPAAPRAAGFVAIVVGVAVLAIGTGFLTVSLTGCGSADADESKVVRRLRPAATSDCLEFEKLATDRGAPRTVLGAGESGFDAARVGSPSVVVDETRPDGHRFLLYYAAKDADGNGSIGLVTSPTPDFLEEVAERRAVVSPDDRAALAVGYDRGALRPTVLLDPRPAAPLGARYRMWFEGRSGVGGSLARIVTCESIDGVTWVGHRVCTGLTPGVHVSFGERVAAPMVVLDRDPSGDRFRMWFQTVRADGSSSIGHADSTYGVRWMVRDGVGRVSGQAVPSLGPGFGGRFTTAGVGAPSVVLEEDPRTGRNVQFHLWYSGALELPEGRTEHAIGYATSRDGLTWTAEGSAFPLFLPVLVPSPPGIAAWDTGGVRAPSAWIDPTVSPKAEGAFLLWFAGRGRSSTTDGPHRIGVASGRVP